VARRGAKVLVAPERVAIVVLQSLLMTTAHYPRHVGFDGVKGSDLLAQVNTPPADDGLNSRTISRAEGEGGGI
jgi:hypothetical protein